LVVANQAAGNANMKLTGRIHALLLNSLHADTPYSLKNLKDLGSLISAHSRYQTRALSGGSTDVAPNAIAVSAPDNVGLGNRLPSIATAYVMALFTGRLLLVSSNAVLQQIDLPFPADWHQHRSRYSGLNCLPYVQPGYSALQHCVQLSNSSIGRVMRSATHNSDINNSINGSASIEYSGPHLSTVVLLKYRSIDYDMPLLQVNPQLIAMFTKFFTNGEVFHAVARYLFKPKPALSVAMQPYLQLAKDCAVGLHMRHRKPFEGRDVVQAEHFAGIARMLSNPKTGTIFIASDTNVFNRMHKLLGSQLWWSNLTMTSVASTSTSAGNPGTEVSAFVDMFLLASCQTIVVTPASSFGCVAAGIAGVKPVFATYGRHEVPFLNTWFWQSVTSEPCMFKASKAHQFGGEFNARLKEKYRLYMYQTQCHW
jgi:hypothetical protein